MMELVLSTEDILSNKTQHLRVSEAAEKLGVSTSLIHKWIRTGLLATDGRFGISPRSPYRIARSEITRLQHAMDNN